MNNLTFDEHLMLESLDKPWELKDATDSSMGQRLKSQLWLQNKEGPEPARFKFFDAPEGNGHVIEYANNGAMEIHHMNDYGESGTASPQARQPNTGFVATMAERVKHHLSHGFPVRIVGTVETGLFDHYLRLGKALAKRHGVSITDPVDHPVLGNHGLTAKAFTITPGYNIAGMEPKELKEALDKHRKRNA